MRPGERRQFNLRATVAWVLLLSPVLILGALIGPRPWLVLPAIGTGILLLFVVAMVLGVRHETRLQRERGRFAQLDPSRRRNIFAITRDIPDSVTLSTEAGDLTQLWADTMAPDNFAPGRFENRLEGFVGRCRASKVPDQVYARYADWYDDNSASQGLANPDRPALSG